MVCGHCGICGISALFPLSALYAVMQFAASVESQRREMVRVRIRERLERKHGLTVRAHNLPRFLNDIGLPVRVYEL